jgi:hypothetical protein
MTKSAQLALPGIFDAVSYSRAALKPCGFKRNNDSWYQSPRLAAKSGCHKRNTTMQLIQQQKQKFQAEIDHHRIEELEILLEVIRSDIRVLYEYRSEDPIVAKYCEAILKMSANYFLNRN